MRGRHERTRSAFTYGELIVTVMIIGILTTLGAPRFTVVTEQARVDAVATVLTTVHAAQRIYWLETSVFASNLDDLIDSKLLDPTVKGGAEARYPIRIVSANGAEFCAVAERRTGEGWTGAIEINQDGVVTGQIDPEHAGELPAIRPPSP